MLKPSQQIRYKEWASQIDDWKRSGLTQKEWCANHGMKLSTFKHRIWRLNRIVQKCVQDRSTNLPVPAFAELPVPEHMGKEPPEEPCGSCVMRIRIGDARIELTDNATERQLRLVMEAVTHVE